MDAAHAQLIFSVVLVAVVTIIVFEVMKSEHRDQQRPCICGHLKKDHVRPMDADSKVFWPGGEFEPWQCRKCRCRQFITGMVPAKARERHR